MIQLYEEPSVYEHTIHYDEEKQTQIRVTVNTFRGTEYISLRKYYQDFDEEWKPSKEGVTMPIDFTNSKNLFEALVEIISLAEAKDVLETHFKEVLDNIYR